MANNNNSVLITHQIGFLADRVRITRTFMEGLIKTGSLESDAHLFKIDEPIKLFEQAIQDCIKHLEQIGEVGPAASAASWKHHLGFFQKRLRRARVAHKQLETLSKIVTIEAYMKRVEIMGCSDSKHQLIRRMHERRLIDQLQADSLNDLITLQVPAIVACQACVYAATVTEVTGVLKQIHLALVATERN